MQDTIRYIINFLCGSSDAANYVGYEADERRWSRYKVVIKPSGFFDAACFGKWTSMPVQPFKSINSTPILFGEPNIVFQKDTCVIYADLVASAFFVLSRYEETINTARDDLGRFLNRFSVLKNYSDRCLVDEWGSLLRLSLIKSGVDLKLKPTPLQMVMTHDADSVAKYRSLRSVAGGVARGKIAAVAKSVIGGVEHDPLFTYPYMKATEDKVPGLKSILFVKVAGKTLPQDLPYYNPFSKEAKKMMSLFDNIGLHLSYEAGLNPLKTKAEKDILERASGRKISINRNHYLACLNPKDMLILEAEGISDDYSMGYADMAGFRLGTCRPVRFINPETLRLTSLTLHPLIVMDRSFTEQRYMGVSYQQAQQKISELKAEAAKYGGEFIMLWHNVSLSGLEHNYLRELYDWALLVAR